MRGFGTAAAWIPLVLSFAAARAQEPPPVALLLAGARVLDAENGRFREDVAVLVRDGRVAAVGPEAEIGEQGATRLDLAGRWLIPGLIDLHSHLLLRPYDVRAWDDQVLKDSLELRTIHAVVAARKTLESGFTTLRDLGTEGAGYADVALRDAVDGGVIPGPRIVTTTRALVATGCYGPSGFDPRWDVPKGAQVADGPEGLRKAVREQIGAGADWIKVYADYSRQAGEPATPTFTEGEIRAAVEEAASAGRRVAAHATGPEAIRRAVLAGVATIEHGYQATPEVLELMREHDVVLCPTLAASEAMARYAGWEEGRPEPARIRAARALMRHALDSGVTIACGSDVGVFPHGESVREIELMVAFGMTPGDALRAATSVAARVLGQGDRLGRIAPGLAADLVVLAGDPLASPTALRRPVLVVARGRLAVDRR